MVVYGFSLCYISLKVLKEMMDQVIHKDQLGHLRQANDSKYNTLIQKIGPTRPNDPHF